MEVSFSNSFRKAFRKRIKGTSAEPVFWATVEQFIQDPFTPRLKTHKLSGKLEGLWSFAVEYDLRVVFYFTKDKPVNAVFVDAGNPTRFINSATFTLDHASCA